MNANIQLCWIVLIVVASCSSTERKESVEFSTSEVALLDSINKLIDSANDIYSLSIADLQMGLQKDSVILRYQSKAIETHVELSRLIDKASKRFITKGKSKTDYEMFINKIDLASVQKKALVLERLGLTFDLPQDNDK